MGVTKTIIQEGTGAQPTARQTVTIEYTGWLKDTSKPDNKGNQWVYQLFIGVSIISWHSHTETENM